MIQERNIVMCIILSIVTCGIYGIYWFICIVNDLNTAADTPNDSSGGIVFLLSIVTCGIYLIYWMYTAGGKVQAAQAKRGMASDSNASIIYLILTIVGFSIIAYCLIQNELNKMAATNA